MTSYKTLFESQNEEWETPDDIFIPLNEEFRFTLDVAASTINKKVSHCLTKKGDGLTFKWQGICWMNPPFGNKARWVKKAFEEAQAGATVVCLLPARTNTNWWQDYCMKGEIRFIRGRPKFKGCKYGLPQPLAIVIFRPPNL